MKLYTKKEVREKYSKDRSPYKIKPAMVAFPNSEQDVKEIVNHARKKKMSITARGGGTGLSGAAIGKGIVIDFTKRMNKIFSAGKTSHVQSGTKLKQLTSKLRKKNYFLPSVPLYQESAIGGNINTSTIGPRTVKYGLINKRVKSLRGILADGRVLDTAKTIPADIAQKLRKIQKAIQKDKNLKAYLKTRPFAAGGYNLNAFFNKNINKVVKDLIIGSTGTLILLTEIVLKPEKYKKLKDLYLLYFKTYDDAQKALNKVLKMGVATIEYAGKETLELWGKAYKEKNAVCAIIVGFETKKNIKNIHALVTRKIAKKDEKKLWKARRDALPKLEKEAKQRGVQVPPGIDDTTFHTKDFAKIIKDVKKYEKKNNVEISSFGHIGVGSMHLRPFINIKNYAQTFDKVGRDIFKIVKKYNGTLIGEHNSGFCRSRYLPMESKKMYNYMKKVKKVFDPENILNPKVMFNLDPITKNLDP